MTKEQKEVQQAYLSEEKKVIRQLKQAYSRAAKDCEDRIAALNARTDMQNLQAIVYQKQYQEALKKQIDGILDTLQTEDFETISEYLTASYENGYAGAMYDLHSQGIPVISPINQNQVVKAVETDSKISTNLYTRLGEDVDYLKKSIRDELSRGTASGASWLEIAQNIASGMNNPFDSAMKRAVRIARTEGHRIQNEAQLDALEAAKDNGADIVKQWDSTLDSRTRPDHREADGQIVELDEYFVVGGERMKAPGVGGSARQVCNCRCCLLQRARWALDEDELETLKEKAAFHDLDKTADFEEFKKKYLQAAEKEVAKSGTSGIVKAITLEDISDADTDGEISDECKEAIVRVLNAQAQKGDFSYDSVRVVTIPRNANGGLEVLRTNVVQSGNYCDTVLEINATAFGGKTKADVDSMFKNATNTVCNSLEEAVAHETGHARTIYGRTFANYERINEELQSVHKAGISKLAESDGLEYVAECEVLLSRGDTLPEDAMEFYMIYTTGGG